MKKLRETKMWFSKVKIKSIFKVWLVSIMHSSLKLVSQSANNSWHKLMRCYVSESLRCKPPLQFRKIMSILFTVLQSFLSKSVLLRCSSFLSGEGDIFCVPKFTRLFCLCFFLAEHLSDSLLLADSTVVWFKSKSLSQHEHGSTTPFSNGWQWR